MVNSGFKITPYSSFTVLANISLGVVQYERIQTTFLTGFAKRSVFPTKVAINVDWV